MSLTHCWLCFIAFGDLETEVTYASIDDLKEFPRCKSTMQRNLFYSLFKAISDTITTRPAHVEGTTSYNRDRTPNSEVSSESNEDKSEDHKTHRPYSWPHQLSPCRVRRLHVSHNIVCFSPLFFLLGGLMEAERFLGALDLILCAFGLTKENLSMQRTTGFIFSSRRQDFRFH